MTISYYLICNRNRYRYQFGIQKNNNLQQLQEMLLKNSSENSLRNVSKNVSKIFLSMLCFGEKRHRIGNTEGVCLHLKLQFDCSESLQQFHSTHTSKNPNQHSNHQSPKISPPNLSLQKSSKIIRYCSSTNSPIHPISSSIKTISKIPYIKTQKSISITHSQTNYNTLYAHFHA